MSGESILQNVAKCCICTLHLAIRRWRLSGWRDGFRKLVFFSNNIPLYSGASNISSYIPDDTFINIDDFNDIESLISFTESLSDNQITNIKKAQIDFEIFNFTTKIIDYYSKSNLVITRSGASVLGELINFKIPFISIPLPTSADNHQYKNAEYYSKKGYGNFLEEKDIKNKLYDLIVSIVNDKSMLNSILSNQRQHSDKDIFENLNSQIEKILNEKN